MAYKQEETIEIGFIQKSDEIDIKAKIIKKNNDLYFDLREFVHNEKFEGFTKRGLRIHAENFPAFLELVQKIDQTLKESF